MTHFNRWERIEPLGSGSLGEIRWIDRSFTLREEIEKQNQSMNVLSYLCGRGRGRREGEGRKDKGSNDEGRMGGRKHKSGREGKE